MYVNACVNCILHEHVLHVSELANDRFEAEVNHF